MSEPICKKCRAVGQKLFLKGEKCYSPKCPMVRKPYRPGIHGKKSRMLSEYGRQLLEKQKVKWIYGLRENQMKRYFEKAKRISKNKSISLDEAIFQQLERRLDNVIFRLNFASSRRQARQFVSYGHFLINGRKVDIPSYQVKEGDTLEIKPNSSIIKMIEENKKVREKTALVPYLEYLKDKIGGRVLRLPRLEDVSVDFDLSLVIEFYSR